VGSATGRRYERQAATATVRQCRTVTRWYRPALLRPALDVFQHQRQLQCDLDLRRTVAPEYSAKECSLSGAKADYAPINAVELIETVPFQH
jgi:hypothetical protein